MLLELATTGKVSTQEEAAAATAAAAEAEEETGDSDSTTAKPTKGGLLLPLGFKV